MRFWDSSALVPLLVAEAESPRAEELRDEDRVIAAWHWTPVECVSALRRRQREGLPVAQVRRAQRQLELLRRVWTEVSAHDAVRLRAERCLRAHALRAGDAGQLAAALVLSERLGVAVAFVTFDGRLGDAADAEGFDVLGR